MHAAPPGSHTATMTPPLTTGKLPARRRQRGHPDDTGGLLVSGGVAAGIGYVMGNLGPKLFGA